MVGLHSYHAEERSSGSISKTRLVYKYSKLKKGTKSYLGATARTKVIFEGTESPMALTAKTETE